MGRLMEVVATSIIFQTHDSGTKKVICKHLTANQALSLPFLLHEKFDKLWGRASFHNWHHVESVECAAFTYLENFDKDDDPLGIYIDIKRWNSLLPLVQRVGYEDFKKALLWAIRYHDTGNIIRKVKFVDGNLNLIYNIEDGDVRYKVEGAEKRSMDIFETVVRQTDLTSGQIQKIIPLARYLIYHTRLNLAADERYKPFAVAMRFFDQVAGSLFCEVDREKMILGLITETAEEYPSKEICPNDYYNFVIVQAKKLLGNCLKDTLSILGQEMPGFTTKFTNSPIAALDFLTALESAI